MSVQTFITHKTVPNRPQRRCVVFIGKTKVTAVTISEKLVRDYVYPPDMVMDGDVLKKEELKSAVTKWILDSQIRPTDTLCIVQESAIFDTTIQPTSSHTRIIDPSTINAFIDSVPLQRVVVTRIPQKDYSTKVLVANRDLVSTIYHAFEKSAFAMLGIYPNLHSITTEAGSASTQSKDLIDDAKKHFEFYTLKGTHEPSFELTNRRPQHSLAQINVAEAAQQPVQPWVGVVIVIALVLGALGIWYFQYQSVRQEQIQIARKREQLIAAHQAAEQAQDQESAPLVSVSAPEATSSAAPDSLTEPTQTQLIRVQVIYTATTQKLFDDVYGKLRQAGIYQISNQMSTLPVSENKILLGAGADVRQSTNITDIVRSVGISASTQEVSVDGYDVVIQLGVYTPSAPSSATAPTTTP